MITFGWIVLLSLLVGLAFALLYAGLWRLFEGETAFKDALIRGGKLGAGHAAMMFVLLSLAAVLIWLVQR